MKTSAELKKLYKEQKTENARLRQKIEERDKTIVEQGKAIEERDKTIEEQGKTIEEQGKAIKVLQQYVADFKRRMGQYDNFNTPPSMKKGTSKSRSIRDGSKSRDGQNDTTGGATRTRGGQKGHKGTTRKPKPTEFKDYTPNTCPECGSDNLSVTLTEKRDITKAVRTVQVITTRHTINTCKCNSCGLVEIRPETNLPDSGSYDSSITTEVADDYLCRMPFKMIADRMTRHGIPLSASTAHTIMYRAGMALGPSTRDIADAVRNAKILHADETSIHLNGHNVWVWILFDPLTGNTLFVIQDSRGAKVLKEVLEDWDGILVCDGWSAYSKYRIQRCWSHIIREARDIWERNPDRSCTFDVLKRLRKIYNDAKESKRCSHRLRQKTYTLLLARIDRLVAKYANDPILEKFMIKIRNARNNLFQFVLDPEIPSTNNAAERGLREIVVHRKVRGGIRAKETMTWMANLFSCVMTWKNTERDYLAEMAKYV